MTSLQGVGRVLTIGVARGHNPTDQCLRQAGYRVGHLPITRETSHLPLAAASFQPHVVYVAISEPMGPCLDALETLAGDPRTAELPLVALVPHDVEPSVITEAYARSGCDFLRLAASPVELLARTHLLVRLTARASDGPPPIVAQRLDEAANDAPGTRLDLRDPSTGVYSPTYFRHRLQQEVARSYRYQRPLTLLAVHCPAATRDDVAAKVASMLASACRNVDLVARIEPDLFAVLLPETTLDGAEVVVTRTLADAAAAGAPCRIGSAGLGVPGDDGAYSAGSLFRLACSRAQT